MIRRLVLGLVTNEIADIRRRLFGLALVVAAFLLVLLAGGFAFVALYHWLSAGMPQWQAAAWVAGTILAVAILLLVAGRATLVRRNRYHQEIRNEIHALMGQVPGTGTEKERAASLTGIVATAALVGFIIGKRLVK